MRIIRQILTLLLLGVIGLVVYEAYLVWRADGRAEGIFAKAMAASTDISPNDLTERQMSVLLKVEDPAFYSHNGVDFSSPGQGLTTIPQALVKRLFFENFQPGFAKLEQSLIAMAVVDRRWSKEQQMQLFLNHAYLGKKSGNPVIGFPAGAQAHFSKSFKELNEDEFIGLVGMLVGPNALRPDKSADAYNQRLNKIKNYIAGKCEPADLRDVYYKNC
ncbi:MAG: transglycosylase domain-containing protein [Hyphomicrobiales bacterium]